MSLRKNIRSKKYMDEVVNRILNSDIENPQSRIVRVYGRKEYEALENDINSLNSLNKKYYNINFSNILNNFLGE
jgi:hypothetical protein